MTSTKTLMRLKRLFGPTDPASGPDWPASPLRSRTSSLTLSAKSKNAIFPSSYRTLEKSMIYYENAFSLISNSLHPVALGRASGPDGPIPARTPFFATRRLCPLVRTVPIMKRVL
ncbi:MAG: hypothetical protein CL917_12820 [Deltaproteobacteria bacterium]|nr:hypothetical protein [Deltaproteobacteria bacterium]